MAASGKIRIFLLMISLLESLESMKLLSEMKMCGDLECETSLCRVQAIRDYRGPDCRFLNFSMGEEIFVNVKLLGEREDLWAGSKGMAFGYFPKEAVQVEEVFISKEVEVPSKESDFICLHGSSYHFENEENSEHSSYEGFEYPYPDADERDFKRDALGNLEEEEDKIGADASINDSEDRDPETSSWAITDVTGWFGLGREHIEESSESTVQPLQANSVGDEGDLRELQDSELVLDSVESERESEIKSQPELQPEPHLEEGNWLDRRFSRFLGFGEEDPGPAMSPKGSDPPMDAVDSTEATAQAPEVPYLDMLQEKEETVASDVSTPQPRWLHSHFRNMLDFAYAEGKVTMDEEENGGEGKGRDTNEDLLPAGPNLIEEQKLEAEEMTASDGQTDEKLSEPANTEPSSYWTKFLENQWSFKSRTAEEGSQLGAWNEENPVEDDHQMEQESSAESHDPENVGVEKLRRNDQPDKDFGSKFPRQVCEAAYQRNAQFKDDNSFGHPSEGAPTSEVPAQEESSTFNSTQLDTEDAQKSQILQYLLQFGICDLVSATFSITALCMTVAVAALPEDMRLGPAGIVGVFTVLFFLRRCFQSVKSRLYLEREKRLAAEVAELMEEKCKALDKLSLCKREYEDLTASSKDASLESVSSEISSLKLVETSQTEEASYERLNMSNSKLEGEIETLEKELEEGQSKFTEQNDLLGDVQRKIESLEEESKSTKSQLAEARTTLKIINMNEDRLRTSIQDALEENSDLQESQNQLLQEAERWNERFRELDEEKKMLETSKADKEEVLNNTESQIKSLTEFLLSMKDWTSVLEEEKVEGNHWEAEVKSESENREHLGDQQKRIVKKLIDAAKLNAHLKTLETERNQLHSKLSDENKVKEELLECIKNLQTEQATLQSENAHFESENQKLQQKFKVMTELYQENERILHRKLTEEENDRLQREEKLSKADEKMIHAAEELNTYRERAKDLEEELKKTIRSYQSQVTSHEKKAHDNWLSARANERQLGDLKKENSHCRQKLTELELKFDLLKKDPFALDVPNRAFGREHSPYRPSSVGRPSSETRAFLSPPTLMEGPLRLSPMLPGGGGRGSRGPGTPMEYLAANESGELSSDRLPDPHLTPSDIGSLSLSWDREPRILMPPSGQPYPDPTLSPQGPEIFYSSSPIPGRHSGPGEHRRYSGPSFDKPDGPATSEMETSENSTRDDSGDLSLPESSLLPENEASGFIRGPSPHPPGHGPFLPMDPRGPFMRRGLPFPPPLPGSMYGAPRDYFPPRDFPGPPPPPFGMRSAYPYGPYSHYPPPRAGYFPPFPESRNDPAPETMEPASKPPASQLEPQQDT
ncbi:melanoma inhibitory activity protein 2 isoform X3 [Tachyglossus aculeatus]|uniref:melanoma inhibitory activity protein 2 isoform X3 n=1 Tax=Tachyglossus aculeatus TaxID=9261 RepID=UPI0018F6A8E4|nr:melanoma inhibitory activity protein 2 isoform X3 [Tachyglossus aculeatus]